MTPAAREELSRAESFLRERNFAEVLTTLKELGARQDLTEDERLVHALLESRLRLRQGRPSEALGLAENALHAAGDRSNPSHVIDLLIVKAESAWRTGRFSLALEAVDEGEGLLAGAGSLPASLPSEETEPRCAELLRHRGIVLWYKGDLDRSLECHQLTLAIHQKRGDNRSIAHALNNMGLAWRSKGDFGRALEYHQKSLAIYQELDDRRCIASSLNNLGVAFQLKGDLPRALECLEQSLALKEELGLNEDALTTLVNLGTLCQIRGDLDLALQHYQRSLAIAEELGLRQNIPLALGNIGEIHRLKGDLCRALECYRRSLQIHDELGAKEDVARMLGNIGETYRQKGDPVQARDYYQRSLALSEELGDSVATGKALLDLLSMALDNNDRILAEEHLGRLERLNERADSRAIDQDYRLARALLLKTTTRARHKVEAQQILEELVQEDVADHALTVTAMIHLCDVLLAELKMTGDDEVLGEVKELTARLEAIATKQCSHSLLAETYLLRSKLALMELNVGEAQELLVQALAISEERGLDRLARAVAHERDSLQSQLDLWESIVRRNPPKREMIDLTGIDSLLELMVQKTVSSLVEEGVGLVGRGELRRKYRLVHLNLLAGTSQGERSTFRVGIAQTGLSRGGDILTELYAERTSGLFGLRDDMVEVVRAKLREMVERASAEHVNILIFPELTIDLGSGQLRQEIATLARTHNMCLIPGSYHDQAAKRNVSTVVCPDGVLWEQSKHIPAVIRFGAKTLTEGIAVEGGPREITVGNTEFGRIAIVICRDFLDMDLRVELKNCEPPVDLLINPAFTPVTADFRAAHFDARRSIFAYCFFANVAEFGDSLIYTPEKERTERSIPPREENLIYKDVDLFRLRSERKKWEVEQTNRRAFIQSTRHG